MRKRTQHHYSNVCENNVTDLKQFLSCGCHVSHTSVCEFSWTETMMNCQKPRHFYINSLSLLFHLSIICQITAIFPKRSLHLTSYCGSCVRWLSSLNSSWMLVTSASVLSDVHLGGWAVPFPMLTSENGIFEGVLNAGINLEPRSFFRQKDGTEFKRKITICYQWCN